MFKLNFFAKIICLLVGLLSSGCMNESNSLPPVPNPVGDSNLSQASVAAEAENVAVSAPEATELRTAYFAGGCFWCVEAIFESIKGVREAVSGYSGGVEPDPDYALVSRGITTHAESVKVIYDPEAVDFATLVKAFFASHDPTQLNRQGPDVGEHYRSAIFYQNAAEFEIIHAYIKQLKASGVYADPIVTEVAPFKVFYQAEDYHQNYKQKNPDNPYVKNVSMPRLKHFQKQLPELQK